MIAGIEAVFRAMPLSFLEVWGGFGYLVGILLLVAAFGGFTIRPGGRWGIGREVRFLDAKALYSIPITLVMVFVTGYMGSGIVLVPGAQTFESLKDVAVFVCIVLFGFPALLAVPPAYMLSDLVEGVPPAFLQDWLLGYFINPACFWLAYQLIGKNPDFRRRRTWARYLLFVLAFMSVEPELWGYICAGKFTPEISYRVITPALFFTTAVTWTIAPFAMLVALPLAKKYGMFWADIPGRVRERALGRKDVVWNSGNGETSATHDVVSRGVPLRMFIAAPFIAVMLLVVGAVAYVSSRRGEEAAYQLAGQLHKEIAKTIDLQLDNYLATLSP
ncbi:MAG: PAS domain-containing protein, partial [bacterium]